MSQIKYAVIVCSVFAYCQVSMADVPAQETRENSWQGNAEKTFRIELDMEQPTDFCKSTTTIGFLQMNDVVNVTGEVAVEDCSNAIGGHTISVRIRDVDGEVRSLHFEESWERSSNEPHAFSKDYSIGENVDLINVRARRPRCVCNDAEIASESASEITPAPETDTGN